MSLRRIASESFAPTPTLALMEAESPSAMSAQLASTMTTRTGEGQALVDDAAEQAACGVDHRPGDKEGGEGARADIFAVDEEIEDQQGEVDGDVGGAVGDVGGCAPPPA